MFWTIVGAILFVLAVIYIGIPLFLLFVAALIHSRKNPVQPKVRQNRRTRLLRFLEETQVRDIFSVSVKALGSLLQPKVRQK